MSNDLVKRKELWSRLNNVKQADWIKAGNCLGLDVIESKKGTSHTHVVRDPNNKDLDDVRGVIAVLQTHLYKQANREIFKDFLGFGIEEDDIWKCLRML